ncbi:hypothetical protein [Martelella radicis]|uniref:Phage tail protein n=1 Tax=Martelella radicis TaxID=1397476 RepID=A0A7W6KNU1_9HYPH|nr:hypothetical protein [Martelella radicis]MBB4123290.1 hypothetical protein [Martelella radicis]
MSLFPTAGAKLYIGRAKAQKSADFTEADFSSETWTEIADLENLGSLGDTSQPITVAHIGYPRERTLKGVRSAGTMEVICSVNNEDAGQIAALAAEKTKHDYAFRLVLTDAPETGSAPAPSERMWIAKVMSVSEAYDEANNVPKLNLSLAVNSNVVKIAATTGD